MEEPPKWDTNTLQPILKRTERTSEVYVAQEFEYDNWGNVTEHTITDKTIEGQTEQTIWTVYANTNGRRKEGEPWQNDAFASSSLPNGMHDRPLERLIKVSDPVNGPRYVNTAYHYDGRGNLVGEALYSSQGGAWQRTLYEVNDQGEVIKKTTPTGQVTTSTYDYSLSRYYKISQKMLQMAQGDESSLDISRATIFDRYTGLPVYSIDGNGGVTKAHYDKVGRRTLVELPDDDDGKWNPLSDENPDFRSNNPKTTIVYNDGDHKIVVEGSLGAVTEYTYNDHGKITEKVQINRYGSLNDGTSFTGKENHPVPFHLRFLRQHHRLRRP